MTPGAIISAAEHPTALGTARSLRGLEIPVWGLTVDPEAPCCKSRVWDRLVHIPDSEPETYVAALKSLGRTFGERPVLFPTQDELVQAVASQRSGIRELYRLLLPPEETVHRLLDKTAFHEWASQAGFAVPESHVVASPDELHQLLADIDYPVILKPYYRTPSWKRMSQGKKVFRLDPDRDLGSIPFDPFEASNKLLLQRWIEGRDDDVHFCLLYASPRDGSVQTFTGRKLLQWPRLTGSTAICTSTINDAVRTMSLDLLAGLDFVGLGSVEFKKSSRDGRFYITEPTVGRTNLQSYVSVAGGTNLVELAFLDAVGERRRWEPSPVRNAMWINEENVYNCLRNRPARRDLGIGRIASTFWQSEVRAFAYGARGDPAPLRHWVRATTSRAVERILRRVGLRPGSEE